MKLIYKIKKNDLLLDRKQRSSLFGEIFITNDDLRGSVYQGKQSPFDRLNPSLTMVGCVECCELLIVSLRRRR